MNRRPMHIAFNGWFWDQPHTGSGQYLRHLLAALHQRAPEHRLTLVVPARMATLEALPPQVDVLPMPLRRGGHPGKVWFEQHLFPRAVARLQADIAHVPYWGPPLRSPAPLICTVLDVIPLLVPEYSAGLRNRLYTSLVRAAARGASHLLTLSAEGQRQIAAHIGVPAERVTVTPLAADKVFHPEQGAERDGEVRARYGLDDADDFVLYLGAYAIHKNVRQLVAAYTYVAQGMGQGVPLVLAGHTPAAWGTPRFPDLPAYIEELGLAPYVRWIGPVDEVDKPALYRLASVFAFPSLLEGFGLGPLEALASGTPVVACEASSIPEVTGDAAYLVAPGDSRAMGGAILSLLMQPDHAATLRNRGLARARDFSWRATAEGTLAAYEQVLGTR
ncbi:MAG: glycosyltransferase family 1 protein [Anaerolineae bacterium]|nr:glycosyltransferase family 1 protein [Anaerolineae bacterium]